MGGGYKGRDGEMYVVLGCMEFVVDGGMGWRWRGGGGVKMGRGR